MKSKVISLTKADVSPYDRLLFPNFPGVNTLRNSVTVFYLNTLPFAISSCRLSGSLGSLLLLQMTAVRLKSVQVRICVCGREKYQFIMWILKM